jgi:hypothetical protein
MLEPCPHERWQYVRRAFSNGTTHFGVQCLDCLHCIKLERHGLRLWLKPEDIPPNAPIHAWIDPDGVSGQGGLFHD